MWTLENTDEIGRLAQEIQRRIERDKHNSADYALVGVLTVTFLALGAWALLLLDPDRYAIQAGRLVLTTAASASIAALVLVGVYCVGRANRIRHDDLVERINRLSKKLGVQEVEQAEDCATVQHMTAEAYRLGRRTRNNGS